MSEKATHVVIADDGIDHNGEHYAQGAEIALDKECAGYHERNRTVQMKGAGKSATKA